METKEKRPERTLIDSQGREIPVKVIDKEIVRRDSVVRKVMERAIRLNERLEADKAKMIEELASYLDDLAKRNGLEWKGNAELLCFDESMKVEVRYRERIQFGIELQLAKQKIDECLKEWTTDSNDNLKAIISEAFQVDKKGEIAKHRILALRRYNIQDETWKEAMELIDRAIQVTSTKQYIAIYTRKQDGSYEQVVLNFSAL
jgi:hypothetical protein